MSLLPAMISYLQYHRTATDSVVLRESLMAMLSVLRYTNPSLDSEFWWDFCYRASCNPLWISGAFSYFTHGYQSDSELSYSVTPCLDLPRCGLESARGGSMDLSQGHFTPHPAP
jgi:hypothetical protein